MSHSDTNYNSTREQNKEINKSPAFVRESPVSKTPQRGNLTGNPRKIRDSAADLYNLIQEWNNHHVTASEILLKINFLKSNKMKEDGISDSQKCYPEGLQELCIELDEICILLTDVVRRMLITRTEVGGVIKLEKLKDTSDNPMFLTWPADRYGEAWEQITTAYETELSLKTYVKENVAHVMTEADLMFYIASWAHQPFIDSKVDITLEALLKETGHR